MEDDMAKRAMFLMVAAAAMALGTASAQTQQGGPGQMGGSMPMHGSGHMAGQMPMMQGGGGQMGSMMGGPMMMQPGATPMGMGCGGMAMMGMTQQGGGMAMHDPVEGRIAFLRAELGVTQEQGAAFDKLAEAMRKSSSAMHEQHAQMMQAGMPASWPDRMARHEAMMSARLAALQQIGAAAQPLYATLSDEQKRTADMLMHGMM